MNIVDTGVVAGSTEDGTGRWTLNDGSGERQSRYKVKFLTALPKAPTVAIWLNRIDASLFPTTRLDVRAENVTTDGFDVVFETWADSHVYGLGATWIAVG